MSSRAAAGRKKLQNGQTSTNGSTPLLSPLFKSKSKPSTPRPTSKEQSINLRNNGFPTSPPSSAASSYFSLSPKPSNSTLVSESSTLVYQPFPVDPAYDNHYQYDPDPNRGAGLRKAYSASATLPPQAAATDVRIFQPDTQKFIPLEQYQYQQQQNQSQNVTRARSASATVTPTTSQSNILPAHMSHLSLSDRGNDGSRSQSQELYRGGFGKMTSNGWNKESTPSYNLASDSLPTSMLGPPRSNSYMPGRRDQSPSPNRSGGYFPDTDFSSFPLPPKPPFASQDSDSTSRSRAATPTKGQNSANGNTSGGPTAFSPRQLPNPNVVGQRVNNNSRYGLIGGDAPSSSTPETTMSYISSGLSPPSSPPLSTSPSGGYRQQLASPSQRHYPSPPSSSVSSDSNGMAIEVQPRFPNDFSSSISNSAYDGISIASNGGRASPSSVMANVSYSASLDGPESKSSIRTTSGSDRSFVIPAGGGRSRGAPKARSGNPPKFSFKRNKGKEIRPQYPVPPMGTSSILQSNSSSPPPSAGSTQVSFLPQSPPPRNPNFHHDYLPPLPTMNNNHSSAPAVHRPSDSNSTPSAGSSPNRVVYPSSRSRATPKRSRKGSHSESTSGSSDGDSSTRSSSKTKFMGILSKNKKKNLNSIGGGSGDGGFRMATPTHLGTPSIPEYPEHEYDEYDGYIHVEEQGQAGHGDYSRTGQLQAATLSSSSRSASSSGDSSRPPSIEPGTRPANTTRTTTVTKASNSKVGVYPLDPYDSTLLESDRLTYELLGKLKTSESPSFFQYGNAPPSTVLDLGCGQGHWLIEAAVAWRGYGTKVVGLDMVDVTKPMRTLAAKNGVADNVSFVKSNFLKKQLPFPDESFDLVRMSCLTYSISYDKWEYLLKEACRVLTVGGRLEIIDDHVFFTYGKPPVLTPTGNFQLPTNGSTGDIYNEEDATTLNDHGNDNTRITQPLRGPGGTGRRNSYASTSGTVVSRAFTSSSDTTPSTVSMIMSIEPNEWAQNASASKQLESLFEHMLNVKYGIHLCPSEFLVEMCQKVFGHARELDTLHLTFAAPDSGPRRSSRDGKGGEDLEDETEDEFNPLLHSTGLVLWPDVAIPLPQQEVEAHALRHNKVLLSCRTLLAEHAVEIAEEEGDEHEVEAEGVMEALWDYEGFLEQRFNPPPGTQLDSPTADSDTASVFNPPLLSGSGSDGDTVRSRMRRHQKDNSSVYSVASEQSALWDYQLQALYCWSNSHDLITCLSDLRQHFEVPSRSNPASNSPALPSTSASRPNRTLSPLNGDSSISGPSDVSATAPTTDLGSVKTVPPSFISHEVQSIAPPGYSRYEPTHIRTFHIFEAIKMDDITFYDKAADDDGLPTQ